MDFAPGKERAARCPAKRRWPRRNLQLDNHGVLTGMRLRLVEWARELPCPQRRPDPVRAAGRLRVSRSSNVAAGRNARAPECGVPTPHGSADRIWPRETPDTSRLS